MKPRSYLMLIGMAVLLAGGALACSQGPAETAAPAATTDRVAPPTMKMTTDIPASIPIADEVETRPPHFPLVSGDAQTGGSS